MDKKEIAEIRRILTKDHCRIDKIAGCFVGEDGAVIAQIKDTFHALSEEDTAGYLELFRKALTGKIGRNLYSMEFPLSEEQQGGRQAQLYQLLRSQFTEPGLIERLCDRIVQNLDHAGRHLILLGTGAYDIPSKTSDGEEMEDASDYVYQFVICCICPVVEVKEGLCFDEETLSFVSKRSDLGVQMPMLGFLFPAFNDRMPDIHELLYYAKNEDERHLELVDELVGAEEVPATESVQKEIFTELVEKTLGRACNFENVKTLTENVNEMIREDKEQGAEAPLELGRSQVLHLIAQTRPAEERSEIEESFEKAYEETVGTEQPFRAESIGGRTVMEIKSPSIKISVKSDMTALITTKIIDGREFLMIPVQDDIEVNGIRIRPGTAAASGETDGDR